MGRGRGQSKIIAVNITPLFMQYFVDLMYGYILLIAFAKFFYNFFFCGKSVIFCSQFKPCYREFDYLSG